MWHSSQRFCTTQQCRDSGDKGRWAVTVGWDGVCVCVCVCVCVRETLFACRSEIHVDRKTHAARMDTRKGGIGMRAVDQSAACARDREKVDRGFLGVAQCREVYRNVAQSCTFLLDSAVS